MKTNKRKRFSVHDLYPADYCFDMETSEADPEHYQFTAEDIAYSNAMELEKYEDETPMTPYEKRALRRWVASGHSVMEPPPSRYPCVYPSCPSPCFLDVYRTDRELDVATKGMTDEEKLVYLKGYAGYVDEPEDDCRKREENEKLCREIPEKAREKIRMLQRRICYYWMFLAEEGILLEADEFVKEHMDEPTPFENEW